MKMSYRSHNACLPAYQGPVPTHRVQAYVLLIKIKEWSVYYLYLMVINN